ncbi:hypothetical protein O3P69_018121 [Scylla paramamosain]|uniref:Uncharacterized protein n=1 Tax=Scylla paramamosain TaxID=85552 RepID=A0AAW0THX2_SCYPA
MTIGGGGVGGGPTELSTNPDRRITAIGVEDLERLGILTSKEVKKLIQKRREFEYRLARRSKKKIDFVNYINYEKKLIELISIRRKQFGVNEKKHLIETSIAHRVLKYARLLTRLWPSHLDTWALRITFSQFIGWKEEISSAYRQQVKFHGNCESVWISWAKWEIEERQNFDKAREILLSKAPLYHPKSQLLKREMFRLELLYVEMLFNNVKHKNIAGLEEVIAENRGKVLKCAVAQTVYLHAVNTLPEPELYLQLYQVADKFPFAHELREEIYRDLCTKFPGAECLWKLRAQRLISGLGEAKTELLDSAITNKENNDVENEGDPAESTDKLIEKGGKRKDTEIEAKKEGHEESNEEEEEEADEEEGEDSGVEEEEDEMEESNNEEESVMKGDDDDDEKEEESGNEEEDEEVEGEESDAENEEVEEEEDEMEESSNEEESVMKGDDDDDEKEEESGNEEEDEEVEGEESAAENEEVEEEEDEMEESSNEEESVMKVDDDDEEEEESGNEDEEDDNSEDMEEEEVENKNSDKIQEKDTPHSKESSSECEAEKNTREIKSTICVETIAKDVQDEAAAEEVKQESHDPKLDLSTPAEKLDPKGKLALFLSIFDKAMEVVGGKFVNTYIDELLPLLHQCWGMPDMTTTIYKTLLKLFEQHTAQLSPLHFYIWYQVLCQQPEDKHKAQAVLERGVQQHPAASHLQQELACCIVREADDDTQIMKEFKKVGPLLKGESGLVAWKEFAKHLCKDSNKLKLFKAAMDHEDQTVARGMRVLHLQDTGLQEGIAGARKLYQKLKWRPPFCAHLQAQMVELELAQVTVNAEAVREVFNISIQQQGSSNPGMWLAYVHFEKKHGNPLRAGGLLTRAEKELEAQKANVFHELNLIVQDILKKGAASVGNEHSDRFFIEKSEDEESQSKEDVEPRPALASLFEEELTLSYTPNNERTAFFSALHSVERKLKKGDKPVQADDGRAWEKVLELLLDHKISLDIQEVKVETALTAEADKSVIKKRVKPRFRQKYRPTDQLNPGERKSGRTVNDDDIEKILASSEVLKPDFMKKTCLTPYFVSKKKAKEIRKKESEKTKGPGWFNMKAPELTEEAKRDLEVLQMRSVLDPKRHYKNDMKVLPKYFQLAEVVDSPVDFYSSRVPKKQRKRTMAEEIMHDEEALRYQKKKYTEIIAAKQKKQFKHPSVLRKKKTKNVSKKK